MKVEQIKPPIQPVTITLETEEEVRVLITLVANVGGKPEHPFRAVADKIFNGLHGFGYKGYPCSNRAYHAERVNMAGEVSDESGT